MRKLIISCPFGNYLRFRGATSTLGTFTRQYRGGVWRRLWRVLCTVRYQWSRGAWFNRLGLPNPGIDSLKSVPAGDILSVHGFCPADWWYLLSRAAVIGTEMVELNLSCPNVAAVKELPDARHYGITPIAKLGPTNVLLTHALFEMGVRHFHLCNTLPCDRGGMSGKPLKPLSLSAVEAVRKAYGHRVTIIGGGGVTCLQDVRDHVSAGANHVAVGSMLFNPLNWMKIPAMVEYLEKTP